MNELSFEERVVLAYIPYMNRNGCSIVDTDELVRDLNLGTDVVEAIIKKLVKDGFLLRCVEIEACGDIPAKGQRLCWTGKCYPRIPWIDTLGQIDYETCLNKHMLYQDCSLEGKVQFLEELLYKINNVDAIGIEILYESMWAMDTIKSKIEAPKNTKTV